MSSNETVVKITNENHSNTIENTKNCTGCAACKNICPKNAISIQFNKKGFYAPVIDFDLCINCGKCKKICPALNFNSENSKNPICYVAYADDDERKKSTSGAIFPIIANWVIEQDGYVAGVVWNKNWEAEHIITNKKEDLQKMRFSKYVQANTANCFKEIEQLLIKNKLVLFSGTPCQNAGLLNFLQKNYKNLITIDIICHAAPSPKVWQDYLEQNFDKEKITNINFRKKDTGWIQCKNGFYNNKYSSIDTIDGKQTPIGIYYEAFIRQRLSNDACLECKYRSTPRPADFTLGDFWNLYNDKINDKKGLGAVLLNNKKAHDLFNKISSKLKFYKKIDLKGHFERVEIKSKSKANDGRERFFSEYKDGCDLNRILNKSLRKHFDVGLLTLFYFMNYGSALVAYSANKIIESLGFSVLMINKELNSYDYENPNNNSLKFAKENYNISKHYKMSDDSRGLNDLCDTFIVGSDTMWWDTEYARDFSYLDFVRSDKRKISFCTSFAHKEPAFNNNKRAKRKYLFKRFDALSTREESGVKILKNIFDVESTHLWDPTLIADKKIFDDLAEKSTRAEKDFVFAYFLDLTEEKEQAAKYVADKLNLKLKLIPNMRYSGNSTLVDEKNITLEDFMYFCKNADFIITDSFHGTCFSCIYEKKFVSFINARRGSERYKIFLDNNLKNYLLDNTNQTYNIDFDNFSPDFSTLKEKLKLEQQKAIIWLKEALNKPLMPPTKEDALYDYVFNRISDDEYSKKTQSN